MSLICGLAIWGIACPAQNDYHDYPDYQKAVIFWGRLEENDPHLVSLCLVLDLEEFSTDDYLLLEQTVEDVSREFAVFDLSFYIAAHAKAPLPDPIKLLEIDDFHKAYRKQFGENEKIRCNIIFAISDGEYMLGDVPIAGHGDPDANGLMIFSFRRYTPRGLSRTTQHEMAHVFGAKHTEGIEDGIMDQVYFGDS